MKISVAMCTYNGAPYLREQVESIAAQARLPDELVVCDDHSTDATNDILSDFAATAPFPVRHYHNEQNLGSTRNFERVIGLCEGDVIALSDQDDVWRPDKLALTEKYFSGNAALGLLFSDAEIVDEELRTLGLLWNESGFDKSPQKMIREGKAFEVLLPAWWVTGATMAFQARFRDLVLPIPSAIPMIHDGWIALVIAAVSEITFIEEPLIRYRQHAGQQLGAPRRKEEPGATGPRLSAILKPPANHHSYRDVIRTLEAVRSRLSKHGDTVPGRVIAALEDRLKHLNARSALPAPAFPRLALVLRELLTMRYHKYSNGAASAARDIFYPFVERH
jgi:hypothetical protein